MRLPIGSLEHVLYYAVTCRYGHVSRSLLALTISPPLYAASSRPGFGVGWLLGGKGQGGLGSCLNSLVSWRLSLRLSMLSVGLWVYAVE